MRSSIAQTKFYSCALIVAGLCGASAPAMAATYIAIDPPGARFAVAAGINRGGIIAGYYNKGGFLRSPGGTYSLFSPPNAASVFVTGINDGGWVVGWYADASGAARGFVRQADGSIATFDSGSRLRTAGINRVGDVCGRFEDDQENFHGFVRTADGTLTAFDPPGSIVTSPASINDSGAITGSFYNGANQHGFVRAADGTIIVFDPPGATLTVAFSINNDGVIAGSSATATTTSAFIRDADGGFTLFDPDAKALDSAEGGASLTAKGAIAGWYSLNTDYNSRGFLRKANGNIHTFKAPGAPYTFVTGVDSKGAIVGYTSAHNGGHYHAFLREP